MGYTRIYHLQAPSASRDSSPPTRLTAPSGPPAALPAEEVVGIFQPTEVGAPFEIEIDGGVAPGVGNGPSQRCLADLPGSEKDDRGRRAEAGDYRLDQVSPYHITVN